MSDGAAKMKKLLMAFSLIFLSLQAIAFSASSKITVSSIGELLKTLSLECSPRDSICQQTCGNPNNCQIPETICEDCATESSALLHTIFTDLPRVFKSEFLAVDQTQVSQFFKTKKFMTLSHDSFLNLFTPEKKNEIKAQFESLCYIQNVGSALLLTTLNEQNQIDQLVGVICRDQKGQSAVLPMQYNPMFSNKRIYFWSTTPDDDLQLKASDRLSLP